MIRNDRYKNNINLPRAGIEKNYTAEQVQEVMKCMNDPIYFAKTYFKIIHVDKGLIPFELFPYQEDAINKFMTHRNLIINASRQSGKTSAVTVMLLHTALFHPNKLIAVLANKGATAREILKRVKTAYESIPDFLKSGVKEWNKSAIEFENGSIIMAEASSSDNIRGKSVFLLYIDELAFVDNWDEFSASVLPTLSSGTETKIVFSSTPNGLNHFYYYVKAARDKKNSFALVEVPWTMVPGRDDKWKEATIEQLNGDRLKFDQEYNLEFVGSSQTLIAGDALKSLEPLHPVHHNEHLRQYVKPEYNHIYMIVADVSRGKGLDYSAFQVIDVTKTPYKQVCTYRNNMVTPPDYALMIESIARTYNNAHVLVEINDLGQQVVDAIHDNNYEEILYTENKGRSGKTISSGFGTGSGLDRGVRTTKPVKGTGCATLKLLIEQKQLIINDIETISELNTFSRKRNSYEAEPGHHDDLVMCLVLFAWLTVQPYFKDLTDVDIMRALKEKGDEEIYDDLLPFGFINDGFDEDEEPIIDYTNQVRLYDMDGVYSF